MVSFWSNISFTRPAIQMTIELFLGIDLMSYGDLAADLTHNLVNRVTSHVVSCRLVDTLLILRVLQRRIKPEHKDYSPRCRKPPHGPPLEPFIFPTIRDRNCCKMPPVATTERPAVFQTNATSAQETAAAVGSGSLPVSFSIAIRRTSWEWCQPLHGKLLQHLYNVNVIALWHLSFCGG